LGDEPGVPAILQQRPPRERCQTRVWPRCRIMTTWRHAAAAAPP